MNPKQQRVASDREAHAPYNFVPLPEAIVKVESMPSQDRYSGYTGSVTCTLTTETPLYIRCGMSPEAFQVDGEKAFHELSESQKTERARFFYGADPDKPLIPGSSLRGLLRNLVEIVGYGKQQWVTDELLVYRAVGDPTSLGEFYRRQVLGASKTPSPTTHVDYPTRNLRAGYLTTTPDGWAIRPAVEHLGESFVHVEYSFANVITGGYGRQALYDVFVAPARRVTLNRGRRGPGDLILDVAIASAIQAGGRARGLPPTGMVPGVLVESGHMGGPHPKHWHCAIYEPDAAATVIQIPPEMWRIYESDRDLTRGSTTPTRKLAAHGDPLFYLLDSRGQLVFFGPTMMFRLPYPNTPLRGFVPEILRHENDVDLAEAIFGYTKSDKIPEADRACAGRVSIGDAVFEKATGDVWLSSAPITPKVLGSPKPTSFQLYLTQQEPNDRRRLDHYANPPSHKTVIRGHKLYWHQSGTTINSIVETDQQKIARSPKQFTRIRPVARGVSFTFTIYFENLRDFELGALLWAVKLPGKPSEIYRHKLGMGKPLGLGSVHLSGTLNLSQRCVRDDEASKPRYAQVFGDADWHLSESQDVDPLSFLESFEEYVLIRMNPGERGKAERLCDVERIEMLLAMLSWPGPGQDKTRYMTVEPNNEYRNRTVLPDPLAVLAGQPVQPPARQVGQLHAPTLQPPAQRQPAAPRLQQRQPLESQTAQHRMPQQPVQPHAAAQSTRIDPPVLSHPAQVDEIMPGMYLEAEVVRVETSRVVVSILGEEATLLLTNLDRPIDDKWDQSERFGEGKILRVWVTGRNKSLKLQTTMRRP
jgi:CRISPR-associated protein (TIGR03986 family)